MCFMQRKIFIISFLFLTTTVIASVCFFSSPDIILINKSANKVEDKALQDGDIIFQSSKYGQGEAVQIATKSKYSHVGMIYHINGKLCVYEAVEPVRLTEFNDWVKNGDGSHYVVRRLLNADKVLTDSVKMKLKTSAERFIGKNYDLYFGWSDERIYCSELVWKVYKEATGLEIGKLQKLGEFDLSHPIVKKILAQRYGDKIPLDEIVISPGKMFESGLLYTVVEK